MSPLRSLAESSGGAVNWDAETKSATVFLNGRQMTYNNIIVGGKMLIDSETFAEDFYKGSIENRIGHFDKRSNLWTNEYFFDRYSWWHDPYKVLVASAVLKMELGDEGSISIGELEQSENSRKLETVKALAKCTSSGDQYLVSKLNSMTQMYSLSRDNDMGHQVNSEEIFKMTEYEYSEYIHWSNAHPSLKYFCDHFLEQGEAANNLPTLGMATGYEISSRVGNGNSLEATAKPDDIEGAGKTVTVTRNALLDHEFAQAQEVAKFKGQSFIGNAEENFPGIDGIMGGRNVSLKEYAGNKPVGVLKKAGSAETSAMNAGYKDVDVYINAKNVSAADVTRFANNGNLSQIPSNGVTPNIYVNTADGWLHISSNGVQVVK